MRMIEHFMFEFTQDFVTFSIRIPMQWIAMKESECECECECVCGNVKSRWSLGNAHFLCESVCPICVLNQNDKTMVHLMLKMWK